MAQGTLRASETGQRKGCFTSEKGVDMSPAVVLAIVWAFYGLVCYWIYRFDLMRDAMGENDSPFLA
jgi:hypothetical protein